jgi:hypothetical protein
VLFLQNLAFFIVMLCVAMLSIRLIIEKQRDADNNIYTKVGADLTYIRLG